MGQLEVANTSSVLMFVSLSTDRNGIRRLEEDEGDCRISDCRSTLMLKGVMIYRIK